MFYSLASLISCIDSLFQFIDAAKGGRSDELAELLSDGANIDSMDRVRHAWIL